MRRKGWVKPEDVGDHLVVRAYFTQSIKQHVESCFDTLSEFVELRATRFRARTGATFQAWTPLSKGDFCTAIAAPKAADVRFQDVADVPFWRIYFARGTEFEVDCAPTHARLSRVAEDWVAFCASQALALGFAYGYVHPKGELDRSREVQKALEAERASAAFQYAPPDSVSELYWWTGFRAELVERIGRARFYSAPVDRLVELQDGSVLVRAHEDPAAAIQREGLEARGRIRAHLLGLDAAAEIERLKARAAALEPVEVDWDPAVDRLLTTIATRELPVGSRMSFVRRLRAFHPLPILEQGPVVGIPSLDSDSASKVAFYQSLASQLAQKLGVRPTMARTLEGGGPDALLELDLRFWGMRYGKFEPYLVETWLAMAAGAYLGCVIQKRFDGLWSVGKNYWDSCVLIGERAWYPFRRAHHCLDGRTRRQVLQSSLYVFYCAIEGATDASESPPAGERADA